MKTKKTVISSLAVMSLIVGMAGVAYGVDSGQGGGGQGKGGGQNADFERPEGWTDLTQEERQAFMQGQGIELGSNRSENANRPEGVENMTEAEKEAHRIANQSENAVENVVKQTQKRFNKNAKKAENYKKFNGELKEKRNFTDGKQIKNLEAVEFLQQRGILDGYGDGSFKPQNSINRAESIKVLLESLGETPDEVVNSEFSDVPDDAWFAGYVSKAKRKGIVKGYEDGTFKPGKTVNQVELLKIAFESFGIDLVDYPITSISDSGSWYAPYLQYALNNNLLDEDDLDLGGGMTREAFSEVIYRLIQQQENL